MLRENERKKENKIIKQNKREEEERKDIIQWQSCVESQTVWRTSRILEDSSVSRQNERIRREFGFKGHHDGTPLGA